MTKATIPTPDAEALLVERAQTSRKEATELQSKATDHEARASDLRENADKLLNLAAQCEEAVRDLQAHRREHPLKGDEPTKAK